MSKVLSFLLLLISIGFTFGQCPVTDFSSSASVCSEESFNIVNNTTSGISYKWDFCAGDLSESVAFQNPFKLTGSSFARSIEFVKENGEWYAFITSRNNNLLFRLDFGASLDNSAPIINNLGNINNLLIEPEPIHLIKENGIWYALIHNGNNTSGKSLCLVTIGEDITNNTPTAEIIYSGIGDLNSSMEVAIDNGEYIVIVNTSGRKHQRINIGNSITNTIDVSDFVDDGILTGTPASGAVIDFELVKQCDQWYGFGVSFGSKYFYQLSYGTDLFSTPTLTIIGTSSIFGGDSPYRVEVGLDAGGYFAFVTTLSGNFYRIALGEDLSSVSTSSTAQSLGDVGVIGTNDNNFSLDLVKDESEWRAFTLNSSSADLFKVTFPNACTANSEASTLENPESLMYMSSGNYNVLLYAEDANGNNDFVTSTITVTSDIAPSISFVNETICQSFPIQFTSTTNGSGLTYAWDFGDASVSSDPNPTHSYTAAGDYEVTLTVDDGTCGNFTKQTITIYDEPIPDFTIPGGNICTNQDYVFTNTTPGSYGGLISYEWQLDGVTVGSNDDLTITFDSGGTKELKLIASIPGCNIEMAKSLSNIKEGAIPLFSFDDPCVGELVQFANTSTGTITNYSWDFGNGFTSILENPQIEYTSSGEFSVTLELTNADGCITNDTKTITVHPNPTVDFEYELSCENLETQFNDMSFISVDNFDSWSWEFGDGSSVNVDQNPTHVFDVNGSYDVKLITTSSFGCVDSVTKAVTVLPSPVAEFTNNITCEDVEIIFSDQSVPVNGEAITNWGWNLGGVFSGDQNPTHIFSDPLSYDVTLTVTSENLCTSTTNKTIVIPPKATVSFTEEDNCDNQQTKLTDSTLIEGDEITEWKWYYDGNQVGNLSEQLLDFNAGTYAVTLEILTANGCVYQSEQNVTINEAPIADFNPSFNFGAPPLDITFTNTSQGAVSYYWNFKDGNSSTDESPVNTFSEIGDYNVELVATSAENCSDSTRALISVLDPINDLALTGLSLIDINGEEKISMAITNNGTIKYDSIKITIDFEGEFTLDEKIMEELNPNESMTIQLDFGLKNKRLDYLCATVSSYFDLEEATTDDNSACINFNSAQVIINPPFPNPTNGLASFDIIMQQTGAIDVEILDEGGNVVDVYQQTISKGPNKLTLDMSGLSEGIYFVSIRALNDLKKYRIVLVD